MHECLLVAVIEASASNLNPVVDNDVSDAISLPSDAVSDTSESKSARVEVYVTTVIGMVNSLYQLSFSIRSTTPQPTRASAYKTLDVESGPELFKFYAKLDTDRLHEIFQDLRQGLGIVDKDENLMKRLATANTMRRRRFKLWSEHAGEAGSVRSAVEEGQTLKQSVSPRSESPPYESNLEITDSESIASLTPTTYDLEGRPALLPAPPRLAFEGNDFACPYCHVLCPVQHGTERSWR